MLKKLIALLLVVSTLGAHAGSATHAGLKAAFDELNYALTVEWDQKDQSFHQEQMKKFNLTLSVLQAQGLTNSQLLAFVKTEVKNDALVRDIETAFSLAIINRMTSAEASKYMLETMKKSYYSGASWVGETFMYSAIAILAISALVFAVIATTGRSDHDDSDNETSTPANCNWAYACGSGHCYYDTRGHYTCNNGCDWMWICQY